MIYLSVRPIIKANGIQEHMQKTISKDHPREEKKMAVKQTAGRDALGEFAPKFAQLNDDVLFGEGHLHL